MVRIYYTYCLICLLLVNNKIASDLYSIKIIPFKGNKSPLLQSNMGDLKQKDIFIAELKRTARSPEEVYNLIKHYNTFHQPITDKEYLFFSHNAYYAKMPYKVYVPKGYVASKRYPLIVYLRGASTRQTFAMAGSNDVNDDGLLNKLKAENKFLILIPFADRTLAFNWALNAMTFRGLVQQIIDAKASFNVDDKKVFVYGHSDGGRGAFCFLAISPSLFAGAVCYNMGPSLLFDNIFLKNVINRRPYIVQTDLDNINPYQDAESAIQLLRKEDGKVDYHLYNGFQHFDKHLDIDYPNSIKYMNSVIRNPIPHRIDWQTTTNETGCDYLWVTKVDQHPPTASLCKPLNFRYYIKDSKTLSSQYIYPQENCACITSEFSNNVFKINCSGVSMFEIRIDPNLVNIKDPIKVSLNGKVVFNKKLSYDKEYIINKYAQSNDRQVIYINRIEIKVKPD